ncbi:MAG: sporulation protein [Gammaproteobacteria bacterium]|nr:MAG: sporulation protein [Gammaproteobacteria bacterium]RLA61869.1 MAG: sporulation protein [Gammaproteobacteria bacterium]
MAQDFAKRKRVVSSRKAPPRKKQAQRRPRGKQSPKAAGNGWRWYGAGVLTGVFLSFLLYLGTLPTPGGTAQEQPGGAQATAQPPKPRFDFYTMLPGQTTDVEVEPAPETVKPRSGNTPTDYYLLQTGSFRQREDADRRRAELLLLGLTPMVEETNGDNGRWYRVYVGPFESQSKMARARSLTANQNIDTLLLKRSKP